jgi:hypothetical protein
MSWNNALPAWMFLPDFRNAVDAFARGEITDAEVYEAIKDLDYVPETVKINWRDNPDNL